MFSCCRKKSSSSSTTTETFKSGTTQTKIVRTITKNGQTITTTTYSDEPQSTLLWEPTVQWNHTNKPATVVNKKSIALKPASAPVTSKQFEQESLDEHNRLRSLHGCPPLKLNRNMCAFANEWAKKLANKGTLQHRSQNSYGENLYMASGYTLDAKAVVKDWYDEIAQYKFSKPGFSSGTGHFTQVVWKASRELGVGVERRGNSTWVVANYDPPGNYANEYVQNVPKPIR